MTSMSNENNTAPMWTLHIRLSNGTRFAVPHVAPDATVAQLKETLSNQTETEQCAAARQRLIFKGRILDNDRSLESYGIQGDATLFLVVSGKPATPPTMDQPATRAMSSSNDGNLASGGTARTGGMGSNPTQMDPFAIPSVLSNSSDPNNDWLQHMAAMQQQPSAATASSPQQMMQNPLMQSILRQASPDQLRAMLQESLQSNPALQRLAQQNPALQHVLQDPAALDQAIHLMRNPAAMQQAMRNQDLALSQLENMPGGMAALSSMYHQYQQPLEEAMQNSNTSNNSNAAASRSPSSNQGASGQAMPNPWSSAAPRPSPSQQPASTTPIVAAPSSLANPWVSSAAAGRFHPMAGLPPMIMPGTTPTPEQRQEMLRWMENPAMQQMMQSSYQQNPDLFRNMLAQSNPMMSQIIQSNPEAADAMIRSMMNPATMRAMMQMEDAMRGLNIQPPPPGGNATAPGTLSAELDFGSLLNQSGQQLLQGPPPVSPWGAPSNNHLGGTPNWNSFFVPPQSNAASASSPPQLSPAERFQRQLRSLYEMGFDDEMQNLTALQQAGGNVNRAVDLILSGHIVRNNNNTSASSPPSVVADPTNFAANGDDNGSNHDQGNDDMTETGTVDEHATAPPKHADDKKND